MTFGKLLWNWVDKWHCAEHTQQLPNTCTKTQTETVARSYFACYHLEKMLMVHSSQLENKSCKWQERNSKTCPLHLFSLFVIPACVSQPYRLPSLYFNTHKDRANLANILTVAMLVAFIDHAFVLPSSCVSCCMCSVQRASSSHNVYRWGETVYLNNSYNPMQLLCCCACIFWGGGGVLVCVHACVNMINK